jgi:outer membrane protein TolC
MKILHLFIVLFLIALHPAAQPKQYYSLEDIIQQAQSRSPRYKLAQTKKEISLYQYQTYKSNLKPQVFFNGNLPVYTKEYFGVRQPDGTIIYQSISQNNSNIGFSLSQQLPFSGGELSLNTDLARFDDFKAKTKQYTGTPIYLRLSQPLFAVNQFKWNKLIEPLKLEESRKEYVMEMENIAQQAVKLYFDVLDAQSNMKIAEGNLQNTTLNYETEKKRVNLGTTTEDKLLQLELQSLRSKQDLEKSKYDYQVAQLNLRTFLGLKDENEFNLPEPGNIPVLNVNLSDAFIYAKKNRPEFISFERKRQEAMRDVAVAKAEKQQVNLVASYGLNNIGNNISNVYSNPNDQQRFTIGFNVPIVDWGRRKARYNTAKAIEKLTAATNEFDETVIFQEITTLVKNIELLKQSIELAKKTDTVAQRRFTIASNLYQIGKLSVTDLNLAQSEKDNARRTYIAALKSYWDAYYMLRRITLFDFGKNESLYSTGK